MKNEETKKIVYKIYKVGKYTIQGTAYYLGSYNTKEEAEAFARDFNIDYYVIEKVVIDSQGNLESTTLL